MRGLPLNFNPGSHGNTLLVTGGRGTTCYSNLDRSKPLVSHYLDFCREIFQGMQFLRAFRSDLDSVGLL